MGLPRTDPYEPNLDESGEYIIDEAYLRAWARYIRLSIRTVVPATVVSYDAAKQTCKCTVDHLQVVRVRGGVAPAGSTAVTGEGADMNATLAAYELENIRVRFDGANGADASQDSYLTHPIRTGTQGNLVVSDRNLSHWYAKGKPVDPVLGVLHDLASSVFYPGLRSDSKAISPATDLEATVLHGPTIKLHREADQFIAIGTKVREYLLAMLTASVPVAMDGGAAAVASMKAWVTAHPADVAEGAPNGISATKVKAK